MNNQRRKKEYAEKIQKNEMVMQFGLLCFFLPSQFCLPYPAKKQTKINNSEKINIKQNREVWESCWRKM